MIGGHSGEPAPDIAYEAVRERIVRAAARSRVIRRLNLSNQGLEILPTEIGLLTGLKRLNLNNNRLKRLPAEIGLLAELKFLDLDNNRLTGLPAEIGLLTNLEYLDLDNNRLSGLPARIASLNKLYRLSLAKNVFRTLPKQIGKLRSLQVLDADHNKLNVIPSEIGNLWRLWSLYLADNELSALPVELGRLLRLYTLRLNGNPWPESYLRLIGANEQATARNVLAYLRGEPVPDEPDSEGPSEEQLIAASTEQRPAAYRFGIRDDRVDTLPEAPQPRDGGFATDIYDHAIAKTRALHRRLEHTNSARRVVGSTEGVIEALGIGFSSLRPGLLLSRIRSLEADRAGFDSEVGRVELFPDALAMIDDALLSLRDLLAAFPIVREIEVERVALDLDRIPETIPEIRQHANEIVEAATESGGAWDRALSALRRIDPAIEAAADDPILQRSLIADKLLVLRNFGGAVVSGLAQGGRIVGSELAELGGKSWQQIKQELPKGIGTAARLSPLLLLATLLAGSTGGIAASLPAFKPLATVLGRVLRGRKQQKS